MSLYLLDSAILIDHLRGITQATTWLASMQKGDALISVITKAELLSGGTGDERLAAIELCEQFECLSITPPIAVAAAELRRKHRWKLPDAFQAALASSRHLKLATRNTKDFNPKQHGFVLVPYEIPPAQVE